MTDDTLVALHPAPPKRQGIEAGETTRLDDVWREELASATAGLNLDPLENAASGDQRLEIRVWGPLGPQKFQWLVRLHRTAESWSGDVFGTGGCVPACTAAPGGPMIPLRRSKPDWTAVAERLTELRVWTLALTPLPYRSYRDGRSMLVELRDGARYRAYRMPNPQLQEGHEAQFASEIMAELELLADDARRAEAEPLE